jgi:hypothetical protein
MRQKELRYLKTYRAELVAHIGGEPTPIQCRTRRVAPNIRLRMV